MHFIFVGVMVDLEPILETLGRPDLDCDASLLQDTWHTHYTYIHTFGHFSRANSSTIIFFGGARKPIQKNGQHEELLTVRIELWALKL